MTVSFIPTSYRPDEKEMRRLEKLQEEMGLIKAELSYSLREVKGYELYIRSEIFHNKLRQHYLKLAKDGH